MKRHKDIKASPALAFPASADWFFILSHMQAGLRRADACAIVADKAVVPELPIRAFAGVPQTLRSASRTKQNVFGQPISVIPKKLNIIEGSYSMHPTLINNYDLKIFLHIDEKEQSLRIIKRNGASMVKRFLSQWIPLENRYFKELNIQEQSDLVFRR